MTEILAGFDPGHLWGRLDLLAATRHTPDDRQGIHYGMLRALGITRCRDGLPWRSGKYGRMRIAAASGMQVIFDACHFDVAPDYVLDAHFEWIGRASRGAPIWICPMNEPSIVPMMTGHEKSREWATETGIRCMNTVRRWNSNSHFMSVDSITGAGDHEYQPTDEMVATGMIETVGVNYYPHTANAPLGEVILKTWERYRLPVMVSETGWHVGHPEQEHRFPAIRTRGQWLRHVLDECDIAIDGGAHIDGVCIYPITDTPSWNEGETDIWPNGLIGTDLQIEPSLRRVIEWAQP